MLYFTMSPESKDSVCNCLSLFSFLEKVCLPARFDDGLFQSLDSASTLRLWIVAMDTTADFSPYRQDGKLVSHFSFLYNASLKSTRKYIFLFASHTSTLYLTDPDDLHYLLKKKVWLCLCSDGGISARGTSHHWGTSWYVIICFPFFNKASKYKLQVDIREQILKWRLKLWEPSWTTNSSRGGFHLR